MKIEAYRNASESSASSRRGDACMAARPGAAPDGVRHLGALSLPLRAGSQRVPRPQAGGRRRHPDRHVARAARCCFRADRVRRPRTQLPVQRRSHDATAGAMPRPTATTTGRCAIPIPPAPSGCGARIALYDVVVVLGYNDRPRCAGAAAPSSCTWPARLSGTDRRLHRTRAAASVARCSRALRPRSAVAVLPASAPRKKRPKLSAPGAAEHVPGKWRARGSGEARWSADLAANVTQ